MNGSFSFSFKVTQLPSKHHNKSVETAIDCTKRMAYLALLRAMAANPSQFIDMKDGEFRDFKDDKAWTAELGSNLPNGIVYRIQFHKINL